jgi:DHA3 family tetracycline resistance protein-like MFS transporter
LFTSPIQKRDALGVYLILEGASSLLFALVFTVNMVYQVTVVDLNPFQLVLVGTLLETVVFLFEVPTGIVADTYSRRLSVIIGMVLIGFGFMIEGVVPRFEAVLCSQVLWGIGATFTSGATEAWIADEVGEAHAGPAFMRGAQAGLIGGLVGIPLSAGLGSLSIQVPIVLGGVLFVLLGVFLVIVMPEAGFTRRPSAERESWRGTFRKGVRLVRGRSILLIFIGIVAFDGLYSEGFDRLWTAHILTNFTFPVAVQLKVVVWFGLIKAATMLLSIVATEIAQRWVRKRPPQYIARVLFSMNTVMVMGLVVFGLAGQLGIAFAAYLTVQTLRSVGNPLITTWINPHIESDVRATVFSMASQVNAIGQIAGGPVVGVIGTRGSLRAAFIADAVFLAPVLLLLGRVLGRKPVSISPPDSGYAETLPG